MYGLSVILTMHSDSSIIATPFSAQKCNQTFVCARAQYTVLFMKSSQSRTNGFVSTNLEFVNTRSNVMCDHVRENTTTTVNSI